MQVIKFVTKDFKSPGYCGQLDYSKFRIPIEVEADPKERGQCARGIHVVPINENADLTNVLFTDTMILLEVEEEDIVYCENNGKMRVRKATPIRQVVESDKEMGIIRTAACKEPGWAYFYALHIDNGATDETRTAVCNAPQYAYWYALCIYEGATDETRTAACKSPELAYWYAREVDQKPTKETRIGASKDAHWKKRYEQWVNEQCK
jgi:hypothetical protein